MNPSPIERLPRCVCVLTAVSALTAALWILGYRNRGFNFSDEGFYLNWMSQPYLYKASSTQFGFVYHPIYVLFRGDISDLRLFNLVVTFLLGLVFSAAVLKVLLGLPTGYRNVAKYALHPLLVYALAAPIGLTAWAMPHSWMATPSYNGLVIQGYLVAMWGLVIISTNSPPRGRSQWFGVALLCAGLWLAGMAKPPAAVMLTLGVIVYVVAGGYFRRTLAFAAISMVAVLFFLSALHMDGAVSTFIGRLLAGLRLTSLDGAGHDPWTIIRRGFADPIIFSPIEWHIGVIALVVTFCTTCTVTSVKPWLRRGGFIVCGVAAVIALVFIATDEDLSYQWARFEWVLVLFPSVGYCLSRCALMWTRRCVSGAGQPSGAQSDRVNMTHAQRLMFGILLVLLPHFSAFGSNNNIWLQAGYGAIFWIMGALVLGSCIGKCRVLLTDYVPVTMASLLLVVFIFSVTISHPYGQTSSLRSQTTPITLHAGRANLIVSGPFADYLRALEQSAATAGFKPGDPMIDLTGYYPGSLYAIAARPIGRPWFIGGQRGSSAVAMAALDMVSCHDLARAWLLLQPDWEYHVPAEILHRYGIDVRTDYSVVAVATAPVVPAGVHYDQKLLKPTRDLTTAEAACKRSRATIS